MASVNQTVAHSTPFETQNNRGIDTTPAKNTPIPNKNTDSNDRLNSRYANRKRRFSRQQRVQSQPSADENKSAPEVIHYETVSDLNSKSFKGVTTKISTPTSSAVNLPSVTTAAPTSSPSTSSSTATPSSKLQNRSSVKPLQGDTDQTYTTDQKENANVDNSVTILDDVTKCNTKLINQTSSIPPNSEKLPKSNIRRSSSTRSALSLVFDTSQNQEISRSTSASSRCESRQAKYHKECLPVEDPSLKVENWGKFRRERSPRSIKSSVTSRPGSDVSLLERRRESVTNFVFAGESQIDGEDSLFWQRLRFYSNSSYGLGFGRMTSLERGSDVMQGEFDITVDEDYFMKRQSKFSTPRSTGIRRTRSQSPHNSGFLYQVTDFDNLTKDVPPFVKTYAQKNGRMITETFILRLNFLRRRRQLGESSGNININSSGGSGGGGGGNHQGHHPSNAGHHGKRSTQTT